MSANPASQPAVQALDGTAWMQLIAPSLLLGASFIFIRIAAVDIPIFTLVFVRVALAALALHAVILATGRIYPAGLAIYGRYALMGLLNNAVPFILIVYATPRIGAGAASILNATTPIFTLIVAHILTADEKITASIIAIQRRAELNVPIIKMFSNDERLRDLAGWEPPEELAPFAGDARRRPGTPRRRRR